MSDFITFVLASQACRLLVAQWYSHTMVPSTLAILAPSRGIFIFFYCYDIPRYIVTLAILVYRHVSIDDKYRGIAGIAQHYFI